MSVRLLSSPRARALCPFLFVSSLPVLLAQDPPPTVAPAAPLHAHGADQSPGLLRDVAISLGVLVAVGTSTERDAVLESLQGGGHDPRKRGFTLQNVELSLSGTVDRHFRGEAHLVTFLDPYDGETVVELEEAFVDTLTLPHGLSVRAGTFFTGFGRHNAQHPHQWDWLDRPIVLSRLFGPDGLRGPGARVGWHLPVDFCSELQLGVHNGNGETMTSFLASDEFYGERPVGGRFFADREVRALNDVLGTLRFANEWTMGGDACGLGASLLAGPNATGPDGDTVIWGVDASWERPGTEAAPGWWRVQAEFLARAFRAAAQTDENGPGVGDDVPLPGAMLRDHGGWLQVVRGFDEHWSLGLRGEWAGGRGDSYDQANDTFGRAADPFRSDRFRLSPVLGYRTGEGARLRLQYSWDDADWLADEVHSVWFGFEVMLGGRGSHGGGHAGHRH